MTSFCCFRVLIGANGANNWFGHSMRRYLACTKSGFARKAALKRKTAMEFSVFSRAPRFPLGPLSLMEAYLHERKMWPTWPHWPSTMPNGPQRGCWSAQSNRLPRAETRVFFATPGLLHAKGMRIGETPRPSRRRNATQCAVHPGWGVSIACRAGRGRVGRGTK